MPAVTADTLTLPHIKHPELAELNSHTYRPVSTITTAPSGYEGDGFPVRRAFAGVPKSVLDPFVHMDQMGEIEYLPNEARGTDWHPPPRLRNRHLHYRRRIPTPGLPRWRRQH